MKKNALLIIDVQNDYFPHGKMELTGADQALSQINKLKDHFTQNQQAIIYIQHIVHQPNAPFFEVGTSGVELHPYLKISENSIVIEKHFPNSFFQTNLKEILDQFGIEKLVICGMMTHMCVDATTRAAAELGYNPIVISNATATKDLSFDHNTVQAKDVQTACLAAFQMFAQVHNTATYLLKVQSSDN